jgi:2-aminobenzoate-CoA ligase
VLAAVIGVPDVERGMIVKAFVVLKPDTTPTPQTKTLQDHVKSILAPSSTPADQLHGHSPRNRQTSTL